MECPFIQEALNKETRQLITENGIRNIAIMSIAPTGSISNIVLSYMALIRTREMNEARLSLEAEAERIRAQYRDLRNATEAIPEPKVLVYFSISNRVKPIVLS